MTKTVKNVAFWAFIAGALCGLAYWFLTYVPPEVAGRMERTDEVITEAETRTNEFAAEVREHREQVIERTVVIREKVQAEVGALDADGLAVAALSEIGLWRGSSGDSPPARSSGVDD